MSYKLQLCTKTKAGIPVGRALRVVGPHGTSSYGVSLCARGFWWVVMRTAYVPAIYFLIHGIFALYGVTASWPIIAVLSIGIAFCALATGRSRFTRLSPQVIRTLKPYRTLVFNEVGYQNFRRIIHTQTRVYNVVLNNCFIQPSRVFLNIKHF